MVRLLAVSDEVDEVLYADPSVARGVDLIVSCGDLPFDYLEYLMGALGVPLVLIPGNHDPDLSGYRISRAGLTLRAGLPAQPPWPPGAVNADGQVVDVAGLRLAGLGGSLRYHDGSNQYSDRQLARRARLLAARAGVRRLRDGRRVDVLLTHAPPRGVGDADDPAHHGFAALPRLVLRLRPRLLLHGHIHPFGNPPQQHRIGATDVHNVVGRHIFEIDPGREAVYTGRRAP